MKPVGISWERLKENSSSKEISFESFVWQVAYQLFSKYGHFEYNYNEPGSEFYLHLTTDCPELYAKSGQVVGWQAKFWMNSNDPDNTSFNAQRRSELSNGLELSLKYKPAMSTWIVCTPGRPINTAPHRVKDKLVDGLRIISDDVTILFWNRPIFESFYMRQPDKLSHLFWHYFGDKYIGNQFCEIRSRRTINELKDRYDVELYTPGKVDKSIWEHIHVDKAISDFTASITYLERSITWAKEEKNRDHGNVNKFKAASDLQRLCIELAEKIVFFNDKLLQIEDFDKIADLFMEYGPKINSVLKLIRQNENGSDYRPGFHNHTDSLLNDLINMNGELRKISQNSVNVLASAGYGKTCLVCHIASQCITEGIPAILLTGRMFNGNTILARQIVDRLGLPQEWNLDDVFACLNNLGFLMRKKIPVIIDGLNESVPDCSFWNAELGEIVSMAKRYRNIIIVTTTRTAYCQKIFDKESPDDVLNSVQVSGFTERNLNGAIAKYFDKYNIFATNWSTNHSIFSHPILLKMFCVVNQDSQVEINHSSVYDAIDKYTTLMLEKAATVNGQINPLLLSNINARLKKLCQFIWDNDVRSVGLLDVLINTLDPGMEATSDWKQSITFKLLEEGLFISREVLSADENIEFIYDLVAGVVITKMLFVDNDKANFSSHDHSEFQSKLGTNTIEASHPLAEDIIRSLIYFWPLHNNGEQFFMKFRTPMIIRSSFEMLDVISSFSGGVEAIRNTVLNSDLDNGTISHFLRGAIDSIIRHGNYNTLDLLFDFIAESNVDVIDTAWSEAIRERQDEVLPWLYQFDTNASRHPPYCLLLFLALLFSSPINRLRLKALEKAVMLGSSQPCVLLDVFRKCNQIVDLYIQELLYATLLGATIRCNEPLSYHDIKNAVLDQFRTHPTNHIWILDYADSILEFISDCLEEEYSRDWLNELVLNIDKAKSTYVLDESQILADCDHHPFDYDFIKMHFLYFQGPEFTDPMPDDKEIIPLLIRILRAKGYDCKRYKELDKKVLEGEDEYMRHSIRIGGTYRDKIAWVSFCEHLGVLAIKKQVKSDLFGFRLVYPSFDPTLPKRPRKRQLLTKCFLANPDELLMDWLDRKNAEPYFTSIEEFDGFVLLLGRLVQHGKNDSRIDINRFSMFYSLDKISNPIRFLSNGSFYGSPSYYKVFAGELDWRLKEEIENTSTGYLMHTTEFYHIDEHDSLMDVTLSFPFLHHKVIKSSELKLTMDGIRLIDAKGNVASKLIWDGTSSFLYVRKDIVNKYCAENNLNIVWYEHVYKLGKQKSDGEQSRTIKSDQDFYGIYGFRE